MKKLYVVGLGPGDPELVTLKGLKKLMEADVIFVPISSNVGEGIALSVVEKLGLGKKVVKLDIAMGNRDWIRKKAEEVCNTLAQRDCLAIAVLGEPSLYSTAMHILSSMRCLADVYIEVVPGVSAIYACADRIPIPLALGNEALAVVPSSRVDVIDKVAGYFDTVVVIKGGKGITRIADTLSQKGYRVLYARRCFTENEVISDRVVDEDYISLIIARNR